jgi:hypothetical protein
MDEDKAVTATRLAALEYLVANLTATIYGLLSLPPSQIEKIHEAQLQRIRMTPFPVAKDPILSDFVSAEIEDVIGRVQRMTEVLVKEARNRQRHSGD